MSYDLAYEKYELLILKCNFEKNSSAMLGKHTFAKLMKN